MAQVRDSSYFVTPFVSPPPPGVTPNYHDPQSRTIEAHIGMGVCIGIAAVLVVLRIYIKLAVKTQTWGWDDCESSRWSLVLILTAEGACLTGFVRYWLL